METSKELLKKALELKPIDRIMLLSGLIESLDEPDKTIDEIWTVEAGKRLKAYRNGKIKGVHYSDVFGE